MEQASLAESLAKSRTAGMPRSSIRSEARRRLAEPRLIDNSLPMQRVISTSRFAARY
jgi:hypothetical protein